MSPRLKSTAMVKHRRGPCHGAKAFQFRGLGLPCRAAQRPRRQDRLVRSRGLEPPRELPHSDLNAARLPIPPRPHVVEPNRVGALHVANGQEVHRRNCHNNANALKHCKSKPPRLENQGVSAWRRRPVSHAAGGSTAALPRGQGLFGKSGHPILCRLPGLPIIGRWMATIHFITLRRILAPWLFPRPGPAGLARHGEYVPLPASPR